MKKLMLVILFFVPIFCGAQVHLELNQYGEFRVGDFGRWENSHIFFEQEALEYLNRFPEAVANPGEFILTQEKAGISKLKPLFKKVVSVEKKGVVYNENEKMIRLAEKEEEREEKSYLIIFSVISIILMISANLIYIKNDVSSVAVVFHLLAAISAVLAIFVSVFVSIIALILSFLVATFVVASMFSKRKTEKIFFLLYYASMLAYFLVVFN
jgi:hypothetical protein